MSIKRKKMFFKLVILIVTAVICVIVLEIVAQKIWHKKYNEWLEKQLHGFDYVDHARNLVIPTPNTKKTVSRYREDLEEHGKILGLTYFEKSIQGSVPSDSVILFSINQYGFKGPDFEIPKPDSVFRILTIGNSCTWGPGNDYFTYPRTIEREINVQIDEKFKVEVINAGILGYNIERVLKRIDEFLAVDPDLVTIYIRLESNHCTG